MGSQTSPAPRAAPSFRAIAGFQDSYPWPWTRAMTLSSRTWPSGAADGSARLYAVNGKRTTIIKALTFHRQRLGAN
jgi:hypothetical protein